MRGILLLAPLLASLLILQSSCASMKQADLHRAVTCLEQYGAEGNYEAALQLYRTASAKYPNDKALHSSYVSVLTEAKRSADREFDKGDYGLAGRTYFLLYQNYPLSTTTGSSLSFTRQQAGERLAECRTQLSQEALRRYRAGELKEAIFTWKTILSFDPDNAGVKKAVETSTTQLHNLEKDH